MMMSALFNTSLFINLADINPLIYAANEIKGMPNKIFSSQLNFTILFFWHVISFHSFPLKFWTGLISDFVAFITIAQNSVSLS